MVDDYRLHRQAQIQLAEGVFRQDEDYRLATFKDWLRTFEWPRHDPGDARVDDPGGGLAQHWITAEDWAVAGWADRSTAAASAADGCSTDEVAYQRREQLTRWHHDDTPTSYTADGYTADGYTGSQAMAS